MKLHLIVRARFCEYERINYFYKLNVFKKISLDFYINYRVSLNFSFVSFCKYFSYVLLYDYNLFDIFN